MLIALAVTASLLPGFALIERKARQPIVTPSTWRVRSLVSGNVVYLGASAVMGGAFSLSTLYIQGVLGLPARQASLAFLPLAVAVGVGGKAASRLVVVVLRSAGGGCRLAR